MLAVSPNTLLIPQLHGVNILYSEESTLNDINRFDFLHVVGRIARFALAIIFAPVSLLTMIIVGVKPFFSWIVGDYIEAVFPARRISPEGYLEDRFIDEERPLGERSIEVLPIHALPSRGPMVPHAGGGVHDPHLDVHSDIDDDEEEEGQPPHHVPLMFVRMNGPNPANIPVILMMYRHMYQTDQFDDVLLQMVLGMVQANAAAEELVPPTKEDQEVAKKALKGTEEPRPVSDHPLRIDRTIDEKIAQFINYIQNRSSVTKDPAIEKEIDDRMMGLNTNRNHMMQTMKGERELQKRGREAYQEFWMNFHGALEIDPSKCRLLEEIFANFMEIEPPIGQSWKQYGEARIGSVPDFRGEEGEAIRRAINEEIHRRVLDTWDDKKAMQYLITLLRLLEAYRDIMNAEEKLPQYYSQFQTIMQNTQEALSAGCGYNRMAGLRTILSECLSLHPALLEKTGLPSVKDSLFAIAMETMRTTMIRETIEKQALLRVKKFCQGYHARMYQAAIEDLARRTNVDLANLPDDFFIGRSYSHELFTQQDIKTLVDAQPDIREEVELEYVIRKELKWTTDKAEAHYFGANDPFLIRRSAVEPVKRKVEEHYKPMALLMEDLTSVVPSLFRGLYLDICTWYTSQGLEIESNLDLLASEEYKERLRNLEEYENIPPPHFNERAIYYYMVKTGLFKLAENALPNEGRHESEKAVF